MKFRSIWNLATFHLVYGGELWIHQMLAILLVLLSDFVIFFEFLLVTDPKIWCSQPTLIFPHLSTLIEYLLSI